MSTHDQSRRAHGLLDDIFSGYQPDEDELNHLRSFLPPLPKQKTLEEITTQVLDAWSCTSDNCWGGDGFDPDVSIEDWLSELHAQLQGLEVTTANTPALPAGMRLAEHKKYGRVVVSPGDEDGQCKIFALDSDYEEGAVWHYIGNSALTFIDIDTEPTKPAHPEFLETEADYENAPEGTIVAKDEVDPWVKGEDIWVHVSAENKIVFRVPYLGGQRRVLRWGMGA